MKDNLSRVEIDLANSLVLASPSVHGFDSWEKELGGYAQLSHIKDMEALKNELDRIKPGVLLLDHVLLQLNGAREIAGLRKMSPYTKIVILSGSTSDEEEWAFFKAGVRGYCCRGIDSELLKKVVEAVRRGELWIRRSLTNRLFEHLSAAANKKNKSVRSALGLLASLTRREYEIAVRVSNGENNKTVADSLSISERTVKAHLTEVYRKLGKKSRLELALILSGDERKVRRGTTE